MSSNASKLAGLTKADFHAERLPVIDALVAFVATDMQPVSEVQEQIDARGRSRWYPTEGGHFVKMPYQGDPVPMEHFRFVLSEDEMRDIRPNHALQRSGSWRFGS
jgi:hypothetical protein